MRLPVLLLLFLCLVKAASAQSVYTIKADSVKITGCDSSELIVENHSQGLKGFLYNTGNGRTIFRKGLIKLSDSLYLIGADSLKYNAWVQGGNAFGGLGVLGTRDNNHIGFYSNNTERMRLTNTGRLLIGTTTDNGIEKLQVNGSMTASYFANFTPSSNINSGALRLKWGTPDGAYIGFYFQGTSNRRAFVGTPADSRPLIIADSVAFSFLNTPKIAIGSEWGFNNAKVTIVKPYTQTGIDVFNAGRYLTDTTSNVDLQVKANGNVLVGGGADRGYPFQVTTANGAVVVNPNLSRPLDQIRIGGALNTTDGQNALISVSDNGTAYKSVLVERDGNIGLGTAGVGGWVVGSPSFRIASSGYPSVFSQYYFFGNYNGPFNSSALVTSVSNTNEWQQGVGNYPTGQNYYFFGTVLNGAEGVNKRAPLKVGADQLVFMTGAVDAEVARFSEAGYLGLGTATPSAQLHTTGTIRFAGLSNADTLTRVLVSDANGNLFYRNAASLAGSDVLSSSLAVNWPDYVFDAAYRLPALQDLQKYVEKYKHLPGIPSAADVAKGNVRIGENQVALLKKIEELTLYAASQDEKLRKQAAELDQLKQQMTAMKEMIMHKNDHK